MIITEREYEGRKHRGCTKGSEEQRTIRELVTCKQDFSCCITGSCKLCRRSDLLGYRVVKTTFYRFYQSRLLPSDYERVKFAY